MGLFNDIPLRANGQKFYYHWFNALRTAGVAIENFLGGGFIIETSFTLANNQAVAANVTGLVIDSASYKAAHIFVRIQRKTDSSEVVSVGVLKAVYRTATTTWEILDELSGDYTGVTFSITSAGQVKYTSTNIAGTNYTGTMKFKAITFA
jgi:hypothetical protein